ncbi:creatine kinase M-type-like, partial [Geospiza fortis]|uniref:Creatine kinase M-type n=1 Tax=Geospiza fortis TaxID=48883 RepID=A0A8N5F6L5_GEOFO
MPFSNTHNKYKLKFSAEEEFPDLSKHNNHMAKVLTPALYAKLRDKETPSGFTLDDVIQTGVDNPGHPFIMTVGCVAGDEESYEVFKELFDPVIQDRHGGYKPTDKHRTDLNHENLKGGEDLDPKSVLSSPGFGAPGGTWGYLGDTLWHLDYLGSTWGVHGDSWGHLGGAKMSHPMSPRCPQCPPVAVMSPMSPDVPHYAGLSFWGGSGGVPCCPPDVPPTSPGCPRRHNDNKTFLVWVNEEDHLRVISMEKGGNMKEVFRRFCVGLKKIEEIFKKAGHPFMWTEHLGYILTCPSNLGTGLRGGVHVRLQHLSQHPK